MQTAFVLFLIGIIMAPSFAEALVKPKPHLIKPRIDMCPECVDLMDQTVEELIQYIANSGVIGGCSAICVVTGPLFLVCDAICSYVGIEVFIEIINKTDPDPIYICQLMDICNHVDGGQVKIVSATVSPTKGPVGTTFNINMIYVVTNATGPGTVNLEIDPPDTGMPMIDSEFTEGQADGKYQVQWQLDATPNESEPFSPGSYAVSLAVCEGDCETVHEWSGVYATAGTQFQITGN